MFYYVSKVRFADIGNGTTNTLMASESIIRPFTTTWGWGGAGGYWGGAPHGSIGFTTLEPPNTPLPDTVYACKQTNFAPAPCVSQTASP